MNSLRAVKRERWKGVFDGWSSCTSVVTSRTKRWVVILLIALLFSHSPASGQTAPRSADSNPVARYIQAILERNLKDVIDLNYDDQARIAGIKRAQPQVLWPKLIGDYYSQREAAASKNPMFWDTFLGGNLPRGSKWKITETRPDNGRFRTFVTVDYASPVDGPLVGATPLKEQILEFVVDARTQTIATVNKVAAGNVFWDQIPLKILNVAWGLQPLLGGSHFWTVTIEILGGNPSVRSTTRCGGDTLEILAGAKVVPERPDKPWINVMLNDTAQIPNRFPLSCTVAIEDSKGNKDQAAFDVPANSTPFSEDFCWIRDPWFHRGQAPPQTFAPGGAMMVTEGCVRPILQLKDGTASQVAASANGPSGSSTNNQLADVSYSIVDRGQSYK